MDSRGEVTDDDLSRIPHTGYSDAEITEIVANVVINLFTNYFHHVAQAYIDFPKGELFAKR